MFPFLFSFILDVYFTMPLYGFPSYMSLSAIVRKWFMGLTLEITVYQLALVIDSPARETIDSVWDQGLSRFDPTNMLNEVLMPAFMAIAAVPTITFGLGIPIAAGFTRMHEIYHGKLFPCKNAEIE